MFNESATMLLHALTLNSAFTRKYQLFLESILNPVDRTCYSSYCHSFKHTIDFSLQQK